MKKYLIVLAAALVALAGCKQKEDPNELKSISFKQTELTALVGDTIRLALVATPAEAQLPTDLVWASSDEEVAQIIDKKGNVALVGSGEANITAKNDKFTAVCKITAAPEEAFFNLDWLYYFPSTEEYVDETDTIEIGGKKCLLKTVDFIAPNNFDFGESLDPGASGYILWVTAVMPFVVDNNGDSTLLVTSDGSSVFTRRIEFIDDETQLKEWTALRGTLDPEIVGPVLTEYCNAKAAGESPSIDWNTYITGVSGAAIAYSEVADNGGISGYVPYYGFPVSGYVQLLVDEEGYASVDVDYIVAWTGGWNYIGIATNWDAETWDELIPTPYDTEFYYFEYKTGQLGREIPQQIRPKFVGSKAAMDQSRKVIRTEKPVRAKFEVVKL